LLAARALLQGQFVDGQLGGVETLLLVVTDLTECASHILAQAVKAVVEFFAQVARGLRMRRAGLIELVFDQATQRFSIGERSLFHPSDIGIQFDADVVDARFGGLVGGFQTLAERVHLPDQLVGQFQHHVGGGALLLVQRLQQLLP
jgi:hypothetical protein